MCLFDGSSHEKLINYDHSLFNVVLLAQHLDSFFFGNTQHLDS